LSVAAAILAAGQGTRLASERPKPLVTLVDRPLVTWALDAATASGLTPVLLVVGAEREAVAAAAPTGVVVVHSERWHEGIAHSLHAVLDALEHDHTVAAVCVGLADQPLMGADAYRRLASAHVAGAAIAVATYDGKRRNPVLLGRDVWPEARRLVGDTGARTLLAGPDVIEVDCTGTGDPRDVDTLEDLRALEGELA
jgi:CTP:molybdopterin cytidylyltransferase MocA